MKELFNTLSIDDNIIFFVLKMTDMKNEKKKKEAVKKTTRVKKLKKITLLDAAIIGSVSPTMGGLTSLP